ncbi:MAG: TolC family protein [Prevotella sp.]|nr:TolC family protein [Prevotella sp.]
MSNKTWLMVLLSALCSQTLCAQSPHERVMGIDELFRLADENSKSIRTFSTGLEAAGEAVKAANAQRLPEISATLSASYLGDGNLWNRHFGDGMSVHIPHFGNNFALEAQQVIYSGGAISGGIALAELGQKMAGLDVEKNRQEMRFMLVGHYLNLYQLSNQMEVLQKNLELTDRMIRHMEVRCKEGTVLKNDITRYELQRENLKLQMARTEDARRIINHQLVTTLSLPADTEIAPDTTLLDTEVKALAESYWQELAKSSHVGLQQAELAVRMSGEKVRIERSEQLPKVMVMAADHLDGPITIEVPVIDKNFNYWYVGVGVKYNIASLFKNNKKLKQARIEERRAKEQQALAHEQVENGVQAAYTNFMTAFTELRTQQKSVELADQNYSVTSNRYRNEQALITDMIDASNTKLSADLALVNARINVVFNYYKMKYVTESL